MDQQNNDGEEIGVSRVKFNEAQSSISPYTEEESGIVQWVMSHSGEIIENKKEAEYVVIGIIVVITLIALYLFFGTSSPEVEKTIDSVTGIEIISGQVPGGI
ncbi:hypothetical protein IIB50_00155 [Patescibacteria group bacterium]|nr:hypothetical protein [Patescibacteria group bacterium]